MKPFILLTCLGASLMFSTANNAKELKTNNKASESQAIKYQQTSKNLPLPINCSKIKADYVSPKRCITLHYNCPEGDVSCQDIDFKLTDRATGKIAIFKAKTISNSYSQSYKGLDLVEKDNNRHYQFDINSDSSLYVENNKSGKTILNEQFYSVPENAEDDNSPN